MDLIRINDISKITSLCKKDVDNFMKLKCYRDNIVLDKKGKKSINRGILMGLHNDILRHASKIKISNKDGYVSMMSVRYEFSYIYGIGAKQFKSVVAKLKKSNKCFKEELDNNNEMIKFEYLKYLSNYVLELYKLTPVKDSGAVLNICKSYSYKLAKRSEYADYVISNNRLKCFSKEGIQKIKGRKIRKDSKAAEVKNKEIIKIADIQINKHKDKLFKDLEVISNSFENVSDIVKDNKLKDIINCLEDIETQFDKLKNLQELVS